MSAALALEGQFSQEGLGASTQGSGGSLATELAKRFVGNNIAGVESAESIWGKMSIDASKLTVVATDLLQKHMRKMFSNNGTASILQWMPSMPSIRTFYADPYTSAILAWASESVPATFFTRIEHTSKFC